MFLILWGLGGVVWAQSIPVGVLTPNGNRLCPDGSLVLEAFPKIEESYTWLLDGLELTGNTESEITVNMPGRIFIQRIGSTPTEGGRLGLVNIQSSGVSLGDLADSYCLSDADVAISPTPVGGTLSGNLEGNIFSPSSLGEGDYQVEYQEIGAFYSVLDISRVEEPERAPVATQIELFDDEVKTITLPFPFRFFDSTYTQLYVSDNGIVAFSEFEVENTFGNNIPTDILNNFIALWWTNLNPDPIQGGSIFYEVLGTVGNQRFILEYTDMPHLSDGTNPITVQMVLGEQDNSIKIFLKNAASDSRSPHTVGIQGPEGYLGYQYYGGTAAIDEPRAVLFELQPNGGCIASKNIRVENPSIASLAPLDSTCIGVDSLAIGPGSPIGGTYMIEVDGAEQILPGPFINPGTYLPGAYRIEYKVSIDSGACESIAFDTLYISDLPLGEIEILNACAGEVSTLFFQNDHLGALNLIWDLGDSTSSNLTNPQPIYKNPGSYRVGVSVFSSFGCSFESSKDIEVRIPFDPMLSFSQPLLALRPIQFSTNLPPEVDSIWWHFGDGVSSTVPNPSHTYDSVATYPLSFIAIDKEGCTIDLDTTVEVVGIEIGTELNMYPNPTHGSPSIFIVIESLDGTPIRLEIFDALGKLVRFQFYENPNIGFNLFEIPIDTLSEGLYFVQAISNDERINTYSQVGGVTNSKKARARFSKLLKVP